MLKIALLDYFMEHTEYLERMVATYVIGFSITRDDLKKNPALKFAEAADDQVLLYHGIQKVQEIRTRKMRYFLKTQFPSTLSTGKGMTHMPII